MSITELDNPVWHSLTGIHQHLAIGGDLAKRYPSDILKWAAIKEYTEEAFNELSNIVNVGETVVVDGIPNLNSPQWEILRTATAIEMICRKAISAPEYDLEFQSLTVEDVPDMMTLVELTKPGPFTARTIEMAEYIGIRQDGQLVAMAGRRLATPSYREISGVCTHPDYRGKGYASLLTKILVHQFQENDFTPFLLVVPEKFEAKRLYERLGFEVHQEIEAAVMRKLAD